MNIVKGYKNVGKKGLVFKNIRFIHATQFIIFQILRADVST